MTRLFECTDTNHGMRMSDRLNTDMSTAWSAVLTRANATALGITCLAVFLHAADGLLVATMLPAIVAEIGGITQIAWAVMLYEVGSIVAGAAGGLLIARRGLRLPMAAAALLFSVGCLVSALADTMSFFLWGRLLQGLGGGGLMAMSFVAVTMLFAAHLRARVIGLISTVWATSAFVGPLIGGLFVDLLSWQAAFRSFAVVATALALWLWRSCPATPPRTGETAAFPLYRLALLSCAIILIAYGGEHISTLTTPLFMALGLALFAGFLWRDAHSSNNRLLPPFDPLLRDGVSAILAMIFCFAAASVAIGAFIPYFLTTLYGYSPIKAGYIIAWEAVFWAISSALVSGQPERRDTPLIALGLTLVMLSTVGFVFAVPGGHVWLIVGCAAAQGTGFGVAFTFMPRLATRLCAPRDQGIVAGAVPTVQRTGYAVGAAYLGIVANMSGIAEPEPLHAARMVFLAGVPMAALGMLAVLRLIRLDRV